MFDIFLGCCCCSVAKSYLILQPHGLQYTRLPCPSVSPRVCSNSCPFSWWCPLSHPLLPTSPPALNLSQHQNLFQWFGSLHQVAIVLELQLQDQSCQWIFRTDFLYDWLVWSPCYLRELKSPAPSSKASILWHSAFFIVQLSHPYTTTGKKHSFVYTDLCQQSDVSAF